MVLIAPIMGGDGRNYVAKILKPKPRGTMLRVAVTQITPAGHKLISKEFKLIKILTARAAEAVNPPEVPE